MNHSTARKREALLWLSGFGLSVALPSMLGGCSTAPPAPSTPVPAPPPEQKVQDDVRRPPPSFAKNAKAYRADAAKHLYEHNAERIYKGKLPPMLYAVGVVQVELTAKGDVKHIDWMRAPKHAPEVVLEIEKTILKAAPFPAPLHIGKVNYIETWLWHKSGRFQLDTLTEGQT
ncbi:MAG: hypothetical protein ACOVKR_10920 [Limnohabitans sp.]|jgi:protein TonB